MMGRTRVSGIPDIGRLGAMIARPGIDTRTWVSFAYADAESVVSSEGHFVDVTLAPSGVTLPCQVAPDYAGPGFGLYYKIHKDDELVVVVPDGDPNHGGLVIKRLFSKADVPPSEATSNPDDIVLHIEKDKMLRLITTGAGKAFVKSDAKVVLDSPAVHLGGEDPLDALILGTTYRNAQGTMDALVETAFTLVAAALTAGAAAFTAAGAAFTAIGAALPPVVGPCTAAASACTAAASAFTAAVPGCTAAASGIGTFESSTYLSGVSKTK